jgi:hypothetical protein
MHNVLHKPQTPQCFDPGMNEATTVGNTALFGGSGYVVFEASNPIGPLSDFPSNVVGAYTAEDGSATEIFQYWFVLGSSN